jgi:hypothetical protein
MTAVLVGSVFILVILVGVESGIGCKYRTHPEWGFGCDVILCSDCGRKFNPDVKYANFTSQLLPHGLRQRWPNLETLFINSKKLRHISGNYFGISLKRLIIEDSGIVDIGKDLFSSTLTLVEVSLASGRMENVHESVFEPIKNQITKLEVSFPCVGSL